MQSTIVEGRHLKRRLQEFHPCYSAGGQSCLPDSPALAPLRCEGQYHWQAKMSAAGNLLSGVASACLRKMLRPSIRPVCCIVSVVPWFSVRYTPDISSGNRNTQYVPRCVDVVWRSSISAIHGTNANFP